MPWTIHDVDRHIHGLTDDKKRQWVAVANSVLDRCLKEGGTDETCAPKAIRQANGVVRKGADMDTEAVELTSRILKRDDTQRFTLGVVYEPETLDSQGDWASAGTIEKACWSFTRTLQGKGKARKMAAELVEELVKSANTGEAIEIDITALWDEIQKSGLNDMHVNTADDDSIGDIVENYIVRADMEIDGQKVKKGSWLLGVVWHPEHFAKIVAGERTGLSMEGTARKVVRTCPKP